MNDGMLVLLLHTAASWFMIGVIWFVQVVHYPLMARVGQADFATYEQHHTRLTGYIVGPAMVIELLTAVALLRWRPATISAEWPLGGLLLLAVIWGSTWAIQIPCHEHLTRGFDESVHRWLVRSNIVRTVCWSLRGVLGLVMVLWGWSK